jgi:hypothetical protein
MIDRSILDAILIIAVLALSVATAMLFEKLRQLKETISELVVKNEARNSAIAAQRAHRGVPGVDAKARTTRRDTDDLPRTGRMSQGVRRVRSDAQRNNLDD